jgi:hypothetical protein
MKPMPRLALPCRRYAVAATTALLLAVTLASPAGAARWRADDPVGDVYGATFDMADPCAEPTPVDASAESWADIEGLAVRHGDRSVRLTLAMGEVRHHRPQSVSLHLRTPGRPWGIELDHYGRRHHLHVDLHVEPDWEAAIAGMDPDTCMYGVAWTVQPCRGLRVDEDLVLDRVLVSVPRSCIGSPRWVRAAADVVGWRRADDAYFLDRWAPDGVEPTTVIGPFGERVPAGQGAVTEPAPARGRVTGERTVVRHFRGGPGAAVPAAR